MLPQPIKRTVVTDKSFWMAIRQALIMILGAIEDMLGIERSIIPKHKKG